MSGHTIAIRLDETRRGKAGGLMKIVILDENGGIVGVPVRGITEMDAKRLVDVVLYAFEYGAKEGERAARDAIRRHAVVAEVER